MTNKEVIKKLESILRELKQRRVELEEMYDDLDVPLEDLADRDMLITARLSSLDHRILQIRRRLRERKLKMNLDEKVKPLSEKRANALKDALKKVSKSLKTAKNFKAAIKLATQISTEASKGFDNSLATPVAES